MTAMLVHRVSVASAAPLSIPRPANLGHRRLSITDRTAGRPADALGPGALCDLIQRQNRQRGRPRGRPHVLGRRLSGHCDTEVLLEAIDC